MCGSFQNDALPICVFWDSTRNNWTQDGCQVAVDEYGNVARNGAIINCTCNKLGVYGVYVVRMSMRFGGQITSGSGPPFFRVLTSAV